MYVIVRKVFPFVGVVWFGLWLGTFFAGIRRIRTFSTPPACLLACCQAPAIGLQQQRTRKRPLFWALLPILGTATNVSSLGGHYPFTLQLIASPFPFPFPLTKPNPN